MDHLKTIIFLSVFLLPLGIRLNGVEGAPVIVNGLGDPVNAASSSPDSDASSFPDIDASSSSPAVCLCGDVSARLAELKEELIQQHGSYSDVEDHTPIRTH